MLLLSVILLRGAGPRAGSLPGTARSNLASRQGQAHHGIGSLPGQETQQILTRQDAAGLPLVVHEKGVCLLERVGGRGHRLAGPDQSPPDFEAF